MPHSMQPGYLTDPGDLARSLARDSTAKLANLSQVVDAMKLELDLAFLYEDSYVKQIVIVALLLTACFGLFTVLVVVASYVLFSKGIKRRATAILLIAILVMWILTVAYWIMVLLDVSRTYSLLHNLSFQSMSRITSMQDCLRSLSDPDAASGSCSASPANQYLSRTVSDGYDIPASCMGTTALTVNVIIGDAIVWWRAWVLWPHSRTVRSICIFTILATTATGLCDTWNACSGGNWSYISVDGSGDVQEVSHALTGGTMFVGKLSGTLAVLSSLLTNVIATVLIAYRTWEHRRIIVSYLTGSSRRTQVERTLALLVESGLGYCAVWVLIAVYVCSGATRYQDGFYYVMSGCLVPLIGMYPTLVIIICAVDQSLNERSAAKREKNASTVHDAPWRCRRGTLSELLSRVSSACPPGGAHDGGVSESPKNEIICTGMNEVAISTP